VVFDLPCCHRKFGILSVELDMFQAGSEFFPETTEPVEIRLSSRGWFRANAGDR
jgi:hypothetical protein